MADICDRSPCDTLLSNLGKVVFGAPERAGFILVLFVVVEGRPGVYTEIPLMYCPFCGTRLDEVSRVGIERFMRPRKESRQKVPAA